MTRLVVKLVHFKVYGNKHNIALIYMTIINAFNVSSINFQSNGYALTRFMPANAIFYEDTRVAFLIVAFVTVVFIMTTSLFKVWFIVME